MFRGFGADETILYQEEPVKAYVDRLTAGRGFDVVLDTVGGTNLDKSFAAAAINGRVAATAGRSTQDLSVLHQKALSLHVVFMLLPMLQSSSRDRHGSIMAQLAHLVEAGKLRPLIDESSFDLSGAADAYRYIQGGKARGKVVVDIAQV